MHQSDGAAPCGFTLIELSIVLVIIGLIVGGVLTGQTLIRQAQLQKIITQVEKYKTAVNTFRGKYNCLPGDCANASTFFSVAGGDNTMDGGGYLPTAGNGVVDYIERYEFWHHLNLAGLIPDAITGCSYCDGEQPYNGWSAVQHASDIAGDTHPGDIGLSYLLVCTPATWEYPGSWGGTSAYQVYGQEGCFIRAESESLNGAGYGNGYASSIETQQMDMKIDDGNPASGNFLGAPGYIVGTGWQNCTSAADYRVDTSATYSNSNIVGCVMYFRFSFF